MKEQLLRFKPNQKYMVFDFETCNLNLCSKDNKPWQLGFILCKGDKVEKEHDFLIRWDDLDVSPDAAKITGFNQTKYNKESVEPKKVLDFFEKYLYDPSYIKVGHNLLGFDVYIHSIFRRLLNKKPDYSYLQQLIDTLCIAKAIKKEIKPPKEKVLSWQYKLTSFRERGLKASITALCKSYDLNFNPAKLHDAIYDVKMNYEIFRRQIWEIEI
jgi:DNA polymerase III epsilon subunit-like protein